MSFHQDRGSPRGPPGQQGAAQNYHPTNMRPPPPQPPVPPYHYDPQAPPGSSYHGNSGYMPQHSDFMQYPPPAQSHPPNSLNQCPVRPPFPKPPLRQGFPEPPPNFPPPPLPSSTGGPTSGSAQNAYHPYMMPPVPPPPLAHQSMPPPIASQSMGYHPPYSMNYPPHPPHPPFPPPAFSPGYNQSPNSFKPEQSFRQGQQYKYEKPMDNRRSPERGYRQEEHRQKGFGYHGDRHKMEFPAERKERLRSPDRRGRPEGGRHRPEYDRGRASPAHRGRDRSRERYRHRESRRSQSPDRHRKRPRSRSTSRDRKRGRWEDERDRRSESSSGPSRERSYSSARSRESEETFADRERDFFLFATNYTFRLKSPDLSFNKTRVKGDSTVVGTSKLRDLYERFEEELGKRQERAKAVRPMWDPPKTKLDEDPEDSSSESDCESDGEGSTCSGSSDSDVFDVIAEIKRKKAHPDRLHEELWYNDPGQMNDGPLCKCSAKARRTGIRHSIYPGEEQVKHCRPMNNNSGKLFHYRITVSPPTNFLTDRPTVIEYDDHEYLFEGFSVYSHTPLTNIPLCRVIRFNIDYTIHFIEEMTPENYCVRGLELFASYLFQDVLELYDWNLTGPDFEVAGCQRFHFMPRFVRFLPDGGKEVLSMHQVLLYLLRSSKPLVPEEEIADMLQWEELAWQKYAEECKGMIVTNPGMKPSSVRIDQLDREQFNPDVITFPVIVHFGIRPAQLSYAGDPQYQKLWKSYVKLRHLLANSPKVKQIDKQKLTQREEALQKIRQKNTMRREVTVELSSQGFWKTGIRSDVCQSSEQVRSSRHDQGLALLIGCLTRPGECVTAALVTARGLRGNAARSRQAPAPPPAALIKTCMALMWWHGVNHAMMLPVLTHHIRYHQCLMHLDELIGYVFKERCLLQLAMTHPSHHLNFGMNPDHARNSLSNCGIRQPKYGDRKVHHMYMRKKGINTLINIMSRLGQDDPSPSR
ncbi:Ribonuclease 3 [Dissostichus eleginoides]|uniref:Ribonuclease 3 n=1 Tax=Dissostichus eleginoides TaxID=100907 RepID=A0AAD9BPA7_DISEL|nr:Ribonuclease 3 [Dissostichus eleginoides]